MIMTFCGVVVGLLVFGFVLAHRLDAAELARVSSDQN
jgi:hypothetical protein